MGMRNFWKVVDDVIKESDVILEVVDARMPDLTRNYKLEKKVKSAKKMFILVINKVDLITRKTARLEKEYFDRFLPCIFVSCRKRYGISILKKKIFELAKKRGRSENISVGVVGYPNTGKSSLINALSSGGKTQISSKAGWTRGVQWINAGGGLRLLDTPGVIPLSDEKDEVKKALIGIQNPSKISDPQSVAIKIVEIFLEQNKKTLEDFYNFKIESKDPYEILLSIGKARNLVRKGGEIDEDRTFIMLIHDWQKGKLLLKN